MPFDAEACCLCSAGTVCKVICRTIGNINVYAFAVLNIDGCTLGTCQVYAVQVKGAFVNAFLIERTVLALSFKGVFYFISFCLCGIDGDMCIRCRYGKVGTYLDRYVYFGRVAGIFYHYTVGRYGIIFENDAVNRFQRESDVLHCKGIIAVGHVACGGGIDDGCYVALIDIHTLSR